MCNVYQLHWKQFMKFRKIATLAILGSALWSFGASAQDLSLGLLSVASPQALRAQWEPLVTDLNKKTGLNVTLYFANNYAGIIDAMRENKVQVAHLGNKSAMEAVDKANSEVFVQLVPADGIVGYTSHLIVHASSNIKDVNDVIKNAKNLSFGNGDVNSTSGYLVPEYYVWSKAGIDTKTGFRASRNANHEANALAVANRQVDLATNNSTDLRKFQSNYPDKFKDIRIVWTSPLIPPDPMMMRKDLAPATAAKIKSFFLSYGADEREQKNLLNLDNIKGFKESSDKQLTPIRQLDLFSKKSKLQADATVSDADKQTQLAEIDKKLKALE